MPTCAGRLPIHLRRTLYLGARLVVRLAVHLDRSSLVSASGEQRLALRRLDTSAPSHLSFAATLAAPTTQAEAKVFVGQPFDNPGAKLQARELNDLPVMQSKPKNVYRLEKEPQVKEKDNAISVVTIM